MLSCRLQLYFGCLSHRWLAWTAWELLRYLLNGFSFYGWYGWALWKFCITFLSVAFLDGGGAFTLPASWILALWLVRLGATEVLYYLSLGCLFGRRGSACDTCLMATRFMADTVGGYGSLCITSLLVACFVACGTRRRGGFCVTFSWLFALCLVRPYGMNAKSLCVSLIPAGCLTAEPPVLLVSM